MESGERDAIDGVKVSFLFMVFLSSVHYHPLIESMT